MNTAACSADQPCVDTVNRIVSVPCYMMEADIVTVARGIAAGIHELKKLVAG
jgi:enhancing lycopene biosynthesis protein 2